MHRAIRPGGDLRELVALYEIGAPVDMLDETGRSALYVAAATGYDEAARWLLNHGADASMAAMSDERSPIHAAAASGHVTTLECLLQSFDSNLACIRAIQAVDAHGKTPAEIAAIAGHLDIVRALLDAHRECTRNPTYERPVAEQTAEAAQRGHYAPSMQLPSMDDSPAAKLAKVVSTAPATVYR